MYVHILDGFERELDIMQQIYATRVTYYFLLCGDIYLHW